MQRSLSKIEEKNSAKHHETEAQRMKVFGTISNESEVKWQL
jgi:hypothetical protein